MEIINIIMLIIIWFAIGVWGFVYWWTKDFDLTTKCIPIMFLTGCCGIFSWFVGWTIHGEKKERILMRRR